MSSSKKSPQPRPNSASPSDFAKSQTLWKDVQDNKRQLSETQASTTKSTTSSGLAHYITENQDLRDKLRASEGQLNEARDAVVVLSRQLNENDRDIGGYQTQLMRQTGLSSMKSHQLSRMTSEFENLNLSQREIIQRSRESNTALINDVSEKQKEISRLRDVSNNTSNQLSVTSVAYSQATNKINRLEDDIELRDRQIESLRRELAEARSTINDLEMVKKSEGLAILEIDHLRSDVQRLVKMLKTTQEFSDFSDFADDTSGSIRFMKGALRQTHTDVNHKRITGAATTDSITSRVCNKDPVLGEKDVWIPHEAFKFAKEFRRQYNGELTDALLEKLLFELNRIWSKREQQRLHRVQNQTSHEVMKLKRQLSSNPSFDEVHSKKTIHRLKSELRSAYTENRKAHAERGERHPPGTHYVNETMKMIKDAQKTKKVMTLENSFLRDQLRSSAGFRGHGAL